MLGLGCFDVDKRYCLQTLKDNLDTDLHTFSRHAERQIDQIKRRALQGEAIPHAEKVFSLFQPHTEWIVKAKHALSLVEGPASLLSWACGSALWKTAMALSYTVW